MTQSSLFQYRFVYLNFIFRSILAPGPLNDSKQFRADMAAVFKFRRGRKKKDYVLPKVLDKNGDDYCTKVLKSGLKTI